MPTLKSKRPAKIRRKASLSRKPETKRAKLATPYEELVALIKEANLLCSTGSLLSWDQETMMPAGGVEHRARQLAQLARLSHEMATSTRIGELIRECERDARIMKSPTSVAAVNVRELRKDYDRKARLPAELVEEEAKLASVGQHVWREARKESDFSKFRPYLEKIVNLLRRKAECYGWERGPRLGMRLPRITSQAAAPRKCKRSLHRCASGSRRCSAI